MTQTKKVQVKLRYETNDGKPIPTPEKYPEEIEIPILPFDELTHPRIHRALMAELRARHAVLRNITSVAQIHLPDWPSHLLQNALRH